MTVFQSLLIVGPIYLILLILISIRTRRGSKDSQLYLLAGGNIGTVLGLFTFAATLFSTFTLLGMPDFFRVHGVGAWIFLAVSDMAMIFGIITVGYYFRKRALKQGYWGMAGFMRRCYDSPFAGIVAFLGAFIFLIPYVAIQIRGVAIFMNQAFPDALPLWVWSAGMIALLLTYSEIGGLKAIIYNDTLQGIVLLIVIWIIGLSCLSQMGGLEATFQQVQQSNEALLSTPGPNGMFTFQFLFGSMIAILLIPFTQPQVSTRLAIMRSNESMYRMAVGVGGFAILIILPTVFIGMYGAVNYPDAKTAEFLGGALITNQPNFLVALIIIGLLAAAISTADSQIFALGSELRSILSGNEKKLLLYAKIGILFFALTAFGFSLFNNDELALLARTSFAGTALMAPMIFVGIFYDHAASLKALPVATAIGIAYFTASLLKLVPDTLMGFRLDLLVLFLLAILAVAMVGFQKMSGNEPHLQGD